MHGMTFKVKGWEFSLQYPDLEGCIKVVMDKDYRSNQGISSIYTKDKYYAATYVMEYDLWVLYELNYIKYSELKDIRKAYLHGNRYHS